jgi:hypothetical protein
LIIAQSSKVKDPAQSASYQSNIYEMLSQALSVSKLSHRVYLKCNIHRRLARGPQPIQRLKWRSRTGERERKRRDDAQRPRGGNA